MNIQVTQNGKQVRLLISTSFGQSVGDAGIYLYWDCGSEILAAVMATHLQNDINEHITAIRKAAYENGWKDAKAKKKKYDYFDLAYWVRDWTK